MNEPKRLVTEFQSPLGRELLHAAATERVPDDLQLRMGSYLIGPGAAFERAQEAFGPQGSATNPQTLTAGPESLVAPQAANGLTSAISLKVGAALMIAGMVGGLSYLSRVSSSSVSSSSAPSSNVPAVAVAPPPVAVAPAAAAQLTAAPAIEPVSAERAPQPKSVPRRLASAPPRTTERATDLDGELRLLDAARRAIVNGQRDAAQSYLNDYQRAFPQGKLKAEAAALLQRSTLAE